MKPLIQIDDEVREMTDEEFQALLDAGWTPGEPTEETPAVEELVTEEPAADPE